jgi:hypothetical protein
VWSCLATPATGGNFAGKSGECVVLLDCGNSFAHEGLELAEKIEATTSTWAKRAVMEAKQKPSWAG